MGDDIDNDRNGVVNDAMESAAGAPRFVLAVQQGATNTNKVYAAMLGLYLMGVFESTPTPGVGNGWSHWALVGQAGVAAAPPPAASRDDGIAFDLNAQTITRAAASGDWRADGFAAGQRVRVTITGAQG